MSKEAEKKTKTQSPVVGVQWGEFPTKCFVRTIFADGSSEIEWPSTRFRAHARAAELIDKPVEVTKSDLETALDLIGTDKKK